MSYVKLSTESLAVQNDFLLVHLHSTMIAHWLTLTPAWFSQTHSLSRFARQHDFKIACWLTHTPAWLSANLFSFSLAPAWWSSGSLALHHHYYHCSKAAVSTPSIKKVANFQMDCPEKNQFSFSPTPAETHPPSDIWMAAKNGLLMALNSSFYSTFSPSFFLIRAPFT